MGGEREPNLGFSDQQSTALTLLHGRGQLKSKIKKSKQKEKVYFNLCRERSYRDGNDLTNRKTNWSSGLSRGKENVFSIKNRLFICKQMLHKHTLLKSKAVSKIGF